jgi:hypothetical protein
VLLPSAAGCLGTIAAEWSDLLPLLYSSTIKLARWTVYQLLLLRMLNPEQGVRASRVLLLVPTRPVHACLTALHMRFESPGRQHVLRLFCAGFCLQCKPTRQSLNSMQKAFIEQVGTATIGPVLLLQLLLVAAAVGNMCMGL